MIYYNGFGFKGEEKLLREYLDYSDFSVAGFSLGAIRAFEYVYQTKSRVDKLQLFSPAFFQNKSERYKSIQLKAYKNDRENYMKIFLSNVAYPSTIDLSPYLQNSTFEDLEFLLKYQFSKEKLHLLKSRGVEIEVFLGSKDKIVNSKEIEKFFKDFATIYLFQNRGHILYG
jgi:surfactin synthase thioesterase subunit